MNPQEITSIWQRIIAIENKQSGYDTFFKNNGDTLLALTKSNTDIFNKLKELLADNIATEKKVDDFAKKFKGHDHPHVHRDGLLQRIWPRYNENKESPNRGEHG